ncbi:MAG TPA: GDSL-type esterase/lipase family protein [Chthoniobacteraceae bacterium]|nr:GDSL-type esterase/lipase family protein [Chthoniobacteraceae bacterium]
MMFRSALLAIVVAIVQPGFARADENKSAPIRVACLGDSITFGAKVNPATESYPAQLQTMLGAGFAVKNFGVGGATMMRRGKPNAFQQLPKAKEFQPQMVIVAFGTNDSRGRGVDYWDHIADFVPDASALLDEILGWSSKPRVLLCLPVMHYPDLPGMTEERKQINAERVSRMIEIRAKVKELAERNASRGLKLVDLSVPTTGRPELYDVDGVHMKAAGYRLLAETLRPEVENVSAELTKR